MKTHIDTIMRIATNCSILPSSDYHGVRHWEQVGRNAKWIMEELGMHSNVPIYFAIWHDCMRFNDNEDIAHGYRAATLLTSFNHIMRLGGIELDQLVMAVRHHSAGRTAPDPIVGICWDADRLDLPRVGITPDPELMTTAPGILRATDMQKERWNEPNSAVS